MLLPSLKEQIPRRVTPWAEWGTSQDSSASPEITKKKKSIHCSLNCCPDLHFPDFINSLKFKPYCESQCPSALISLYMPYEALKIWVGSTAKSTKKSSYTYLCPTSVFKISISTDQSLSNSSSQMHSGLFKIIFL